MLCLQKIPDIPAKCQMFIRSINPCLPSCCVPGTVLARCRETSKWRSLPSRLMEGLRVSHSSLTMSLFVVLTSLNASISSVTLAYESLDFQETLRHSFPQKCSHSGHSSSQRGERAPEAGHPAEPGVTTHSSLPLSHGANRPLGTLRPVGGWRDSEQVSPGGAPLAGELF